MTPYEAGADLYSDAVRRGIDLGGRWSVSLSVDPVTCERYVCLVNPSTGAGLTSEASICGSGTRTDARRAIARRVRELHAAAGGAAITTARTLAETMADVAARDVRKLASTAGVTLACMPWDAGAVWVRNVRDGLLTWLGEDTHDLLGTSYLDELAHDFARGAVDLVTGPHAGGATPANIWSAFTGVAGWGEDNAGNCFDGVEDLTAGAEAVLIGIADRMAFGLLAELAEADRD